jgi:glycerol kinase
MSGDLILAIDQGTTNTKAILVDPQGRVRAEASEKVPVTFPRPGWVESDGDEIWRTVLAAIEGATAGVAPERLGAVAVANQRESVLAWERASGRPLGPCVSWQCRRSSELCEALRAQGVEPLVRERTGLALDPMFSATKARWLLDHIDDGAARAERGEMCIGTVDAWVAWNLSGGAVFATDATNASRTLLLDPDRVAWDERMLEVFGIPGAALPTVRGSSAIVGETRELVGPVPAGVPIAALIGDSHGALFGQGAPGPGAVKATYGTGTSVMAPLAAPARSEVLSSTLAWSTESPEDPGCIRAVPALEGNITATGAALQWLATIVGMGGHEAELERLASSVPDSGGVYLVPAFTGLGAPHWDADARGLITGLSRGSGPAHLARATFDSIAYQVRDVLDVLAPAVGTPLSALYADGGAMQSDLIAQTQADVARLPVLRNRAGSLAALGAAYLAGLAVGTWRSVDEVRGLPRQWDRFEPGSDVERIERGYSGWRAALRRARGAQA